MIGGYIPKRTENGVRDHSQRTPNCCWSSPAQSFLVSGPGRDPRPNLHMFVPSPFVCLEMGSPLRREEGLVFLSRSHFCCTVFNMSAPVLTQRPGKGICTLWTPYACCHFTIISNIYIRYTDDLCQCRLGQRVMPQLIYTLIDGSWSPERS
jgi:hypothetical protein